MSAQHSSLYRLKFAKNYQKKLVNETMKKLNLNRKTLAKELGVSTRLVGNWLKEERLLSSKIFERIVKLLPEMEKYKKHITHILPNNWGQIKGGKIKAGESNPPLPKLFVPKDSNSKYKIATILMTDGYTDEKQISYASKDRVLINIFKNMLIKATGRKPSVYKDKDDIFQVRLSNKSFCRSLLRLSPSYKKSPARGQIKENYLKEPQPTLRFLKDVSKKLLVDCVRLAFTTDGGITVGIKQKKDGIRIVPDLFLKCAHPKLCNEWKAILGSVGLKFTIRKDINLWSGIDGLHTNSISTMKKFLNLGGFIKGAKISKKSKRFAGFEKNAILKLILVKRKFSSIKEIYEYINKVGP